MWKRDNDAKDLGLLALRLTAGGLLAGHGAQKLFGAFGGYGFAGTSGWMESMGLKPGNVWGALAGGGEFGSGTLIALGFLNPIGSISAFGPMIMAWNKVHAGKPIWVTEGGAELPLVYMAVALAVGLTGPGKYSLDEALGIEVPAPLIALAVAGVAAGVIAGIAAQPEPQPPAEPAEPVEEAG
jgi:putative oxidoreductase